MIRSSLAHLHIAAISHPGLTGKNNEDRYSVSSYHVSKEDPRPVVFAVVCDGIGGHRAGEVAEYCAEAVAFHAEEGVARAERADGRIAKVKLRLDLPDASQAIAAHSAGKSEQQGMGATCACAWVIENRLFTAHVGDSRVYLLRGNHIRQLTKDHTWIQEAMDKGILDAKQAHDHPNVHVIRRHLGGLKLPEVDFRLRIDNSESNEESINN